MLWVNGITSTTSGVYHHDTSERRMCGDVIKRPNVRLSESHRMSGCHKLAYLRQRLAGWPQPKVFDFSLKVCVCVCVRSRMWMGRMCVKRHHKPLRRHLVSRHTCKQTTALTGRGSLTFVRPPGFVVSAYLSVCGSPCTPLGAPVRCDTIG